MTTENANTTKATINNADSYSAFAVHQLTKAGAPYKYAISRYQWLKGTDDHIFGKDADMDKVLTLRCAAEYCEENENFAICADGKVLSLDDVNFWLACTTVLDGLKYQQAQAEDRIACAKSIRVHKLTTEGTPYKRPLRIYSADNVADGTPDGMLMAGLAFCDLTSGWDDHRNGLCLTDHLGAVIDQKLAKEVLKKHGCAYTVPNVSWSLPDELTCCDTIQVRKVTLAGNVLKGFVAEYDRLEAEVCGMLDAVLTEYFGMVMDSGDNPLSASGKKLCITNNYGELMDMEKLSAWLRRNDDSADRADQQAEEADEQVPDTDITQMLIEMQVKEAKKLELNPMPEDLNNANEVQVRKVTLAGRILKSNVKSFNRLAELNTVALTVNILDEALEMVEDSDGKLCLTDERGNRIDEEAARQWLDRNDKAEALDWLEAQLGNDSANDKAEDVADTEAQAADAEASDSADDAPTETRLVAGEDLLPGDVVMFDDELADNTYTIDSVDSDGAIWAEEGGLMLARTSDGLHFRLIEREVDFDDAGAEHYGSVEAYEATLSPEAKGEIEADEYGVPLNLTPERAAAKAGIPYGLKPEDIVKVVRADDKVVGPYTVASVDDMTTAGDGTSVAVYFTDTHPGFIDNWRTSDGGYILMVEAAPDWDDEERANGRRVGLTLVEGRLRQNKPNEIANDAKQWICTCYDPSRADTQSFAKGVSEALTDAARLLAGEPPLCNLLHLNERVRGWMANQSDEDVAERLVEEQAGDDAMCAVVGEKLTARLVARAEEHGAIQNDAEAADMLAEMVTESIDQALVDVTTELDATVKADSATETPSTDQTTAQATEEPEAPEKPAQAAQPTETMQSRKDLANLNAAELRAIQLELFGTDSSGDSPSRMRKRIRKFWSFQAEEDRRRAHRACRTRPQKVHRTPTKLTIELPPHVQAQMTVELAAKLGYSSRKAMLLDIFQQGMVTVMAKMMLETMAQPEPAE